MIAFFRYLKGYVRIRVEGFSPERFMNLCSNRNILLWDIEKRDDAYFMNLSIKDFFKLRPVVRKTRTRVAVLKRFGLPFFIPKILARKVFLMGLFAALAFWGASSLFVWEITLSGNFHLTEDKLKSFLAENDVYVGMLKKDLDIGVLEKEMRKNFDVITWTSAKLEGTKLKISIKENALLYAEKEDEEEDKVPCDIVAQVDGTVVSVIVRSGIPCVQAGQEIGKGDLLVSGSIPIYSEDGTIRKYQYTCSDADIVVEYELPVYDSIPFTYEKKEYTGREKKQYYLGWGEKIIPLGKGKISFLYYDTVTTQNRGKLLPDFFLPFLYGKRISREYQNVEHSYSLQEAEGVLADKYAKILCDLEEKGVQITEKNVRIDTESEKWILTGFLRVTDKIGTKVPLSLPETNTEQQNTGEMANE